MNREIKFRGLNAYDEFVYGLPVNDYPNSTIYYANYSQRMCWLDGGAHCNVPIKNGTLCQFTGLKDKNGKEIYEGDVGKWGHVDGGKEYPLRIAVVEIDPDIQFRQISTDYVFRYGRFMYKDTNKWLEVIGNIYENPELMEVK